MAPWFTSDGEYMIVSTTDRRAGLWSTDGLERIDLPADRVEKWAYAIGPRTIEYRATCEQYSIES